MFKEMQRQVNRAVIRGPIQGLDEEKYCGQWLVINGTSGRIVLSGNSLENLEEQAEKQSIERPVYYKVPKTEIHNHIVIK
ncbi:MAG: hypothetical protein WEC84_04285 [Candidatus Andersenbacteria bacterium]